jgi:hypothetical protein
MSVCFESKYVQGLVRARAIAPVVIKICDVILAFNVLQLEEHSEPNCHFAFVNVPRSEEHSEK